MRSIDLRPWQRHIQEGTATLLVGAGISAERPAGLPLATGLVRHLVTPLIETLQLAPARAEAILATTARLRPEVTIDVLLEHLGPCALEPLASELQTVPNAWHAFLAGALANGCDIITTNFDTLIEQSCRPNTRYALMIGTTITSEHPRRPILYKIHGSLQQPRTIAFSVRQVGRGLTRRQQVLVRTLAEDRPLIVFGYSGYDDFDILPALKAVRRTAPGLWVLHASGPLRPLTRSEQRQARAQPPLACAGAWHGNLEIVTGDSRVLRPAAVRPPRVRLPHAPAARCALPPTRCAVALIYLLIEARAFGLVSAIARSTVVEANDTRLLIARATAAEKHGIDLRAAATLAARAKATAPDGWHRLRALADDQAGVISRRQGDDQAALDAYNRALQHPRLPPWLVARIRSHKAVALEYLHRKRAAIREATAVAEYEARVGDLRGLAKSWNNIGIAHMNLHHWNAALDAYRKSENLKIELRDARGRAQTLHNRGKLYFLRKDYDAAESEFLASLRLRRGSARDRHGIAQSLVALATVAIARRRFKIAYGYAIQARDAHRKYGDQRGVRQAQALLRSLKRRRRQPSHRA